VNFKVGLYFTERPSAQTPVMLRLGRQDIDIPAGTKVYSTHDEFTLPVDVDLLSLQPHAHYLAKEVSGSARLPDGERVPLLLIKDWEFHVQDVYRLQTPQFLPRGTVVRMDFVYDNSAGHPRRPPTPPVRVRWGQYTDDEMGDLWFQFLPRIPAERDELAREIRTKEMTADVVGYRALLRKNPRDGLIHANLAAAFIHLGRRGDALEHFQTHTRLEPDSSIAFYNLGAALAASNKPDAALNAFRRAIELDPSDPLAYNGLGGVLMNEKADLAGALAAFERAVRLDPSYANGFNNLGVVLSRLGRTTDALVSHLAAAELDDLHAAARFNAAVIFERRRQYQAAVTLYRESARLSPEDVPARLRLAWLLAAAPAPTRDPAAALRLATEIVAVHPDDPEALDTFGVAAAANGRYGDAVNLATKARTLLMARGEREWAAAVAERLALYSQQKPPVLPSP
jgi:Flp pilus assembly protein TadD